MPMTAEAAADVSLPVLEQVFGQSPAFMVVLSGPDYVIELANPAYFAMIGRSDIIGRKAFEVFPRTATAGFRDLLQHVRTSGAPLTRREVPFTLEDPVGTVRLRRVIDFTYLPLRDASGHVARVLVHGMDVTEHILAREQIERAAMHDALSRQQQETERTNSDLHEVAIELAVRTLEAEDARRDVERLLLESERERQEADRARQEAETANRSKADFLAAMSHELRTPLNAIGGYAELLELGVRGPVSPMQSEDLQRIRVSQRHLLRLVNEILNYARIETGSVQYDVDDVPLSPLILSLEPLIAPQIASKSLHFEYDACGLANLVVRADREKTRQVLLNLLSNAIKFTEPGGQVTLTCEAADDAVLVKVCDSGIGIPDAEQARVFEPFVQVDASLTRAHEGAGLGLAISRDLARGMGGELTVESAPRQGSTFTLRLPRASCEAAETPS